MSGANIPCYWVNGSRVDLPVINSNYVNNYAKSIVVSGSDVYLAGYTTAPNGDIPCYWKNGLRVDLNVSLLVDTTSTPCLGQAQAISVTGTNVYVAGLMEWPPQFGGDLLSGFWYNKKNYVGLTSGGGPRVPLTSIFASGTMAYYTGNSKASGTGLVTPYYFYYDMNNTYGYPTAVALPVLDNTYNGYAQSLIVSGSDIYIAGYTANSSGVNVPCYWKNGVRTDLTVADVAHSGYGYSVAISGDDIYVGGYTADSSGSNVPCYWKNGARTDLSGTDGQAYSIFIKQ